MNPSSADTRFLTWLIVILVSGLGLTIFFLSRIHGCGPIADPHERTEAEPRAPQYHHSQALDSLLHATGFPGSILVFPPGDTILMGGALQDSGFLPASTFKIWNSLIALEAGVIDTNHIFPWNKEPHWNEKWRQDLKLRDAFQVSCLPCFQELARMNGQARMQDGLKRLNYANQDMSAGLDQFWLTGPMRITPKQQLSLVADLAAKQLAFTPEAQTLVHHIMRIEQRGQRTLHGKTGWAQEEGMDTGWFIGWVKGPQGNTPFVSLLYAKDPDDTFRDKRRTLAEDALRWAKQWE